MTLPAQAIERRNRTDRRRSAPHPVTHELADALASDTIELTFQPQFTALDDTLIGAEALVRWPHPEHGVLPGDALVAIAQSGGIARTLSRHIARAAMREAATWPDEWRLSLNVTAMDLFDRSFGEDLLSIADESGFAPHRLTLEITEQALVADLERSARRLAALAGNGVRIALDDFGAGFCNFRYLKVLPLHVLKLDRSMLDGVTDNDRDLAVLRGIVAMARALDLAVVAEGVETAGQRDTIAREGCSAWQGFLGAAPLSPAAFLTCARSQSAMETTTLPLACPASI